MSGRPLSRYPVRIKGSQKKGGTLSLPRTISRFPSSVSPSRERLETDCLLAATLVAARLMTWFRSFMPAGIVKSDTSLSGDVIGRDCGKAPLKPSLKWRRSR